MTIDVRYCAAGHLPPNLGEELTVAYLRQKLPGGILLVNYYLLNPLGTLEQGVMGDTKKPKKNQYLKGKMM